MTKPRIRRYFDPIWKTWVWGLFRPDCKEPFEVATHVECFSPVWRAARVRRGSVQLTSLRSRL